MSDAVVELASTSTEPVKFQVSAKNGSTYVDPTSGTAKMAFVSHEALPAAGDWITAGWEVDSSGVRPAYYVVLTVGPSGAISFTTGYYDVWGDVIFGGLNIQKKIGTLIVDPDLVDNLIQPQGIPSYRIVVPMGLTGGFTSTTGASKFYPDGNYLITRVSASLGTAASGGTTVVTVKKNGTSIYTGGLILAAGQTVGSIVPTTQSVSSVDYLTADVACNGSGQTDLLVEVFMQRVS